MNNNHEIFRDQIQSWLSGQLDEDALSRFETHMSECRQCAARASVEMDLWDMLGQGSAQVSGPVPSVWPEVQQRTFGGNQNGSWFFGRGQLMRATLAACAVVGGLMVGTMLPGLSPTATADEVNNELWVSEASWLDDSATDGLAGIWLDPGLTEESDGS